MPNGAAIIASKENFGENPLVNPSNPENPLPQRKRPAHHPPISRYNCSILIFVTVCTQSRRTGLATEDALDAFADACQRADRWRIGRFLLMPDHVHFFCSPARNPSGTHKNWMSYWKRAFTTKIRKTDPGFSWQRDFWDTQMRNADSYTAKWNYVRENPVRAGLVAHPEDWPYQGELNRLSFS
ncbi:MAG: transposase [Verrucomicrobiota bacterium]